MNRFSYFIVTILYCLGVTKKGQGVLVSQTEKGWDESSCTLAEPDITCSDDGSCVVTNGSEFLINTNVPDNGIWIGFTKTWISYAYVDQKEVHHFQTRCNKVNVGVEFSVSTLGECRRRTGCQTFGIRNSTEGLRCRCVSNSQVYSGTCSRRCEEADEYPCGDTNGTMMFSIYTVETVPPSSHSQDIEKNCLLSYYAKGDFYWESCNVTIPALLCSDTNFSDQNQLAQTYQNENQKWVTAVDDCFVGNHFPATIQSIINAQITDQNVQFFWTGIIKKESIIPSTYKLDNSTNPPVTYAYVEKINQTVNVRFANKNESKKSLCAGDDASPTPSITTGETQTYSGSTTTPVKPTKGSTSRATSTVLLTSKGSTEISDTLPTVNSNTKAKSYPVPEGKDQGGSTAGLAAGLSISLALLFVIIIVLLFLKRRGLLPNLCKHNDDKNSNTADTATEVSFGSTSIGESTKDTMQDLTASNHSYFVPVEVTNKEEIDHYAEPDISDADHHDSTKTSQKDTCNNYDTVDSKQASTKSGLTKLNNNYNKVTLHQTNEYNHFHLNGMPTKYDRQTENEYDISNNVIDGRRDKGYDGDDSETYNHLNNQDLKSSDTGEVYGMPKKDADNDYDTSGALKHIRNTATKDQQPEYAVVKKKW